MVIPDIYIFDKADRVLFNIVVPEINVDDRLVTLPWTIEPFNMFEVNIPNETERKGLITSRVGQGAYRKRIIHRWEY